MDFLSLKALGFIQLSVLLLSSFNVLAYETVNAQPPTLPPAEGHEHHKGDHRHDHHKHPPAPPPAYTPITKPPAEGHEHHKGDHRHDHHNHPPTPPPAYTPTTKPPAEGHEHHKGDHRRHHHHHPPTPPPAYTPTTKPLVHLSIHAPSPLPPRKLVAVQGVVYCKACKHAGIDTLSGATPLPGAVVRLHCKNTKDTVVTQSKTDKKGYFFINAPKTITAHESHECKVFVVSSPLATCNKPTNLHHGVEGAILSHASKPPVSSERPPRAYDLFTVGPFAFEPSSKRLCPR